ncbi:MAG: hydrolase [Planctomycetota bacterium]
MNSGTGNQDGVRKTAAAVLPLLETIADEVVARPLPRIQQTRDDGSVESLGFADALVAKKNADAPRQIFFCIHLDTVYPPDCDFQHVEAFRQDGRDCLRGPGVADAKGGLAVLLGTLEAIHHASKSDSIWQKVGWRVVLNPDEEIGTPASTPLLQEVGRECDFGLLYEPALPDGTLIGARKGSGNFTIVVRGRSAHAGREIAAGRNAVAALCDALLQIAKLQTADESVTVNLGRVAGGTALNVVPDLAVGRFNVRIQHAAAMAGVREAIAQIVGDINDRDGYSAHLEGDFSSPPKPVDAGLEVLQERLTDAGNSLAVPIRFRPSGGVCDGNKLAAVGVPNIDTMGPIGGKIHSDQEYVVCESLVQRSQLGFQMLSDFARHPERFPSRSDRIRK